MKRREEVVDSRRGNGPKINSLGLEIGRRERTEGKKEKGYKGKMR